MARIGDLGRMWFRRLSFFFYVCCSTCSVCERVFALLNYIGSMGNYALEMLLYYVMLSNQKSELY